MKSGCINKCKQPSFIHINMRLFEEAWTKSSSSSPEMKILVEPWISVWLLDKSLGLVLSACPWQAEEMKKRLYRLDRIEKGLQNFLYEDQIRALSLTKRSRRAVWSPETILRAQKIRSAVGTKGYEYLRELGYPLPSYRTLCNRLETKIMVTTDMSCEMLAELGLGLMAPCDSPPGGVEEPEEEELMGVLSWQPVGWRLKRGLQRRLNEQSSWMGK